MNNTSLALVAFAMVFIGRMAMAGDIPGQPGTRIQQQENDCNQGAIGKSGLERSNFINDCMRNGVHSAIVNPTPATSPAARQQKARDCSTQADAQKLSGPPRTTFLNTCLGG